jgi:hypothetical protein
MMPHYCPYCGNYPYSRDWYLPNFDCSKKDCISNVEGKCITPSRCVINKEGKCDGYKREK